ncbi:hypothetical protein [Streptomyces sp. DH24]|uniref:hypothetical protein n=1 Tax=Streptomyces sp. DH24 TaxID=3040123 RepID=UPI002441FAF4|nr:hypothetical protein [Streptomyces sp. DH24]MDG9715886.1 hypothetical protein [Streptomyces sp. DH24]
MNYPDHPDYPDRPDHPEHPDYPGHPNHPDHADFPEPAEPSRPPVVRDAAPDPLAVAVGNASLLGAGYLLMGRRALFAASGAVTVTLVWTVASTAGAWSEVVLLLWWLLLVAHGWLLARGRPDGARRGPRGQRLVALGVTVPVLLATGWLRLDTHGIEDRVTEARENGDCAGVVDAQETIGFGHRLAGASVAARGDTAVDACERLDTARADLSHGLDGEVDALKSGYGTLAALLKDPANEPAVAAALDGFLGRLPTSDPCETVTVTDWLRARKAGHGVLDRSSATAARTAPAALLECGDDLMTRREWTKARSHYRQLLDQYPGDDRTTKARSGLKKVGLAIELDHVQDLVTATHSSKTGYCADPAKYGGAPARRKGTNRALFLGDTEYTAKLPDRWRTRNPAEAALVVCAGSAGHGSAVQTCPYRPSSGSGGGLTYVTFHKVRIPVKVYELRTGKLVADRKVEISGTSCPYFITYYGVAPSDQYVKPSGSDVRDAFSPVVRR